jgi:hypothetical protein
MIRPPLFVVNERASFREQTLHEIGRLYGERARDKAEAALTDPSQLDPLGAADLADIPILAATRETREAAKVWAREVGYELEQTS